MGKKVIEKDFPKSSTISIDIAELKPGIFFLKLLNEESSLIGSNTFVKQ